MMFELFKQDVGRWLIPQQVADPADVTLATTIRLLFRHLPLQAMLWFRFGSWCRRKRIPLMKRLTSWLLYFIYGLEILPGADVEGGLYIAHPIGTVISAKHIGRNCSIIGNITIGMRNEHAFPTIGDNVFIGAGARVLGGIKIGNNAVIGANAVVIHDVPVGATVVGIPARVLDGHKKVRRDEPAHPVSEIHSIQNSNGLQ